MRGDGSSGIVCSRRRGAQLGFRHRRAAIFARPPAIVGIEFDEVGAGRNLSAHGTHYVFAGGFLGALRHFDAGLETLRPVCAGRDDRARGDQHSRARNDSFVDGLFQTDIGKAGAFRAEIAHGRESRHQRRTRGADRAYGAQRDGLVQHLIVPARLVVRMQEEMAVTFDQAWNQRRLGKVDLAHRGGGDVVAHSDDAVTLDDHAPAGVRRGAVEHAGRA